jgi:hypothetical protein
VVVVVAIATLINVVVIVAVGCVVCGPVVSCLRETCVLLFRAKSFASSSLCYLLLVTPAPETLLISEFAYSCLEFPKVTSCTCLPRKEPENKPSTIDDIKKINTNANSRMCLCNKDSSDWLLIQGQLV